MIVFPKYINDPISLIDATNSQILKTYFEDKKHIECGKYSDNGKLIIIGISKGYSISGFGKESSGNWIKILNSKTLEVIKEFFVGENSILPLNTPYKIAISHDLKYIVAVLQSLGREKDEIIIIDLHTEQMQKADALSDYVIKIEFIDFNKFAIMYNNGVVEVRKIDDINSIHQIFFTDNDLIYSEISPDGNEFATAHANGELMVWDYKSGALKETISNVHGMFVCGVDFRNINLESHFSDKERQILRKYGAII